MPFNKPTDYNKLGQIYEASLEKYRRKRGGIFYTPNHITKYIVENTIGKLCQDKKADLQILDTKTTPEQLEKYQNWLLELTICDPACGAGAFLNQAYEFLIYEHQFILKLGGKNIDYEYFILKNNLFGVDINEESVEIAQLSLWLHTARRGRKLTTLSNNIKCGNSLIDDPKIVGEKAFDWKKEFPQIFDKGGFDVVIGNPPYGAKINKDDIQYLISKQKNQGLNKVLSDTYLAFYIQSLTTLLQTNGLLGFITPNTWRLVQSGLMFRHFMLSDDFSVHQITQHLEKVFIDATVDCDTVIIQKTQNTDNQININIKQELETILSHDFSQQTLRQKQFINLFLTKQIYALKAKIKAQSYQVGDFYEIKNGVKPYEKGKPAQTAEILKNKPFTSPNKLDESFLPLLGGSQFHRYQLLWQNDYWIKYGEWLAAPRDKKIFETKEKLIFRQTSDKILGHYLYNGFVVRNNTHILLKNQSSILELKCLLAILNSRLVDFYYWTINPERGEALAEVKAFHIGLLPFPKHDFDTQPFIQRADKILLLNSDLQKVSSKFLKLLQAQFSLDKVSKKLQKWHELEFEGFLKELKKAKVKLSLADKSEWMDFFETEKTKAQTLQSEIQKVDSEIDQMVYQLYGLTEEEIKIVENN